MIGISVGYFSNKDAIIRDYSEKISMICVYILLIFMGMSTAQNEGFLEIFTQSGKIAVLLAVFGMLGSILLTLPVYKFFKSHKSSFWSFLKLKNNNISQTEQIEINTSNTPKLELKTNTKGQKQEFTKIYRLEILLPIACYFTGVMISFFIIKISTDTLDDFVLFALYGLLFFTGIGIGQLNLIELLKRYHILIIIIPFLAIIGSLLGALIVNQLFGFSKMRECLSINAGMGYYSISAIINKSFLGDKVGLIALLTNLLRETATMLLCPFLVRLFGPLAPVSTGGATTMDTTLPFIRKNTSSEYALIAFFNGVILTVIVPPLTSFIASF